MIYNYSHIKYKLQTFKYKALHIYYRVFRNAYFYIRARKRKKANENKKQYHLVITFRDLEASLRQIEYPNNSFNKMMSMILSDIELFGHIVNRFKNDRRTLAYITRDDEALHFFGPNKRSYPVHPFQEENNTAIKIDTQSLFVFGMILINRSLLLLKMYLSDKAGNPKKDMYGKIGNFYYELTNSKTLSPVAQRLKDKLLLLIKWLYSALRFYRNEFIEHLDKGYQQGTNYGVYTSDFALTSYKWDYDVNDDIKIENFRSKLESAGVKIPGRSGHRSLVNRYYVQRLFDNIELVPDNFLDEALSIIEDIGVHSPEPNKVISQIETYMETLFNFMISELNNSELSKYKKANS